MSTILFVRAKSNLDPAELDKRLLERRPRFLDVPGLVQKIYGRDESTGVVCGIYFFEDKNALAEFRETELAKTIPIAYEVEEIRMEIYEILYPLHPDRGPIAELAVSIAPPAVRSTRVTQSARVTATCSQCHEPQAPTHSRGTPPESDGCPVAKLAAFVLPPAIRHARIIQCTGVGVTHRQGHERQAPADGGGGTVGRCVSELP